MKGKQYDADTKQNNSIISAEKHASEWLKNYGITIDISIDKENTDICGEYEADSIFTDTISITVYPRAIRRACQEDRSQGFKDKYSDVSNQTKVTIFHEIGHALVEKIIDWIEYYPQTQQLIDADFEKKYDSVINDSYPEEDLVEDFAWDFLEKRQNPLMNCFEEIYNFLCSATD